MAQLRSRGELISIPVSWQPTINHAFFVKYLLVLQPHRAAWEADGLVKYGKIDSNGQASSRKTTFKEECRSERYY